MLVEDITSRQNPLVKRFRRVSAGDEHHHIFSEGVRLLEDALLAGAHFESVAFTPALENSERGLALLNSLKHVQCRGARVTAQVMNAIADTETPQGVAAIVSRPRYELADAFEGEPQLIVIADQLQDPGNLGTIIRTAEAAGASGVITTRYTVDAFNRKALRASMGSALRLPVVTDARVADVVAMCRERKVKLVSTHPISSREAGVIGDVARSDSIRVYTSINLTVPVALVLGREASGTSQGLEITADELVHIPMAPGVESLNVAAAAAVLLYEAARQRDFRFRIAAPERPRA